MAFHGPIIFLKSAANALGWAHFNTQLLHLMASHEPIMILGAAANVL